jgi:hypothetical protein
MKKTTGLLWVTLGMFAAVSAFARGGGGGAGEIPTPFLSSNQKVELSDGELYTLVGQVVFYDDLPYFEVDLSQHSWLANVHRQSAPYYPLEASASYLRRFEGRRVKAYVEAHGRVINGGSGPQYQLSLEPLADPVLLREEAPRHRVIR